MIYIERAKVDDVPHIKQVLSDTWLATYTQFLSAETIQNITSILHDPQRLKLEVEHPQLFIGVARAARGKVVGVVTVGTLDQDTIMLYRLYVQPAYQRQGIGEQLLQAGRTAFPDASSMRLEVEEQNHIGRSFYRKQGFRELGTKEEHVGNERLAVIEMDKALV